MRRTSSIVLASLAVPTAAFAGPLKPEQVADHARWMVHMDMESFTQSAFGTCVLENRTALNLDGVRELNDALGIDVFTDILGVTLYSTGESSDLAAGVDLNDGELEVGAGAAAPERAVVILDMTAAADNMLERIKADDSYAEVHKDGLVLHSFVVPESDHRHTLYMQSGENAERRLVIAGSKLEHVVEAISTVKGARPALKGSQSPLAALTPRRGSFMFTAALEMDGFGEDDPASQILSRSKLVMFDMGESGNEVFAGVQVTAATEEDAVNITQIMQGMLALGRMMLSGEEDAQPLVELMNSVRFNARGSVISAVFEQGADRCCELLKMTIDETESGEVRLETGAEDQSPQ